MKFLASFSAWKHWLMGLFVAFVTGFGSGASLMVVAPGEFNLHAGLHTLLGMCTLNGVAGGLLYLKKSPVPEDTSTTN